MQTVINKGLYVTITAVLLAVLLPGVAAAENTLPTNAVQMVTYFPVPLARYNNIFPSRKLDIGTANGDFNLTCGNATCNGEDAVSFTADAVNLRYIAGSPELKVNTPVTTDRADFGKTDVVNQPNVSFKNLYLNSGWTGSFEKVSADTLRVNGSGNVKIYGKTLPACSGTVQWMTVDLSNTEGVTDNKSYLVCCAAGGGDVCAGASPCEGYVTQPLTCTKNNPSGLSHTFAGQVAGTWNSSTCSCDCSSVTYTATASKQSVTGAVHLHQNKVDDKDDYDYCQEKCWSHVTSGHVGTCVNSHWSNPITHTSVVIGAQWNYDICSCNCSANNSNYVNVAGTYSCTHKCDAEYNNGTVAACNSNSAWSWVDGSCSCNCGNYSIYKSSGKGCTDRCVNGNPNWNTTVTNCNNTKGDGGGWYENAGYRGGKYYSSCSCNCGTKTKDGVTKPKVLNLDGTCSDPSF